jgi:hypothetical protein
MVRVSFFGLKLVKPSRKNFCSYEDELEVHSIGFYCCICDVGFGRNFVCEIEGSRDLLGRCIRGHDGKTNHYC